MGTSADARLPEQLHRERLLDIEIRLGRSRRLAFIVLAAGLLACGPWVGWWWIAPLAGAGLAFALADRLMAGSPNPARWAAAGWALSPVMIGLSVALTGAADSPAIAWFALPAATLAIRFETRGVVTGVAYISALMAASTVVIEPAKVADDPSLLIFAFTLTVAVVILSSAVANSDRDHRRDAVLDPLTGLLNRTALAQRLSELEQQAQRESDDVSIGFLLGDLDNFKRINDEHGHAAGDAVLQDVGYALRGALRAFDLAYRVGGEEFAVLLPGAGDGAAMEVAERLRHITETCSRPGIPVSMSLGVATVSASQDQLHFARLFEEADAALYVAKEQGRNRIFLAGSQAPDEVVPTSV